MSEAQHRLALSRGTSIGDFEFHRVLGHGGFGLTYLGWNLSLDIPVAIKEYLPSDLAVREAGFVRCAQVVVGCGGLSMGVGALCGGGADVGAVSASESDSGASVF